MIKIDLVQYNMSIITNQIKFFYKNIKMLEGQIRLELKLKTR